MIDEKHLIKELRKLARYQIKMVFSLSEVAIAQLIESQSVNKKSFIKLRENISICENCIDITTNLLDKYLDEQENDR